MADVDRQYLSQYQSDTLGLVITVSLTPTDPDDMPSVTVLNEDTQAVQFTRTPTRTGVGTFELQLTPDDTAVVGNYLATWTFTLAGETKTFNGYFAVGGAQPAYDVLAPSFKQIVDRVMVRFADMFDSPSGGPNLQTYFQANWGRSRIAQLMEIALGKINTMQQPMSSYTVDGNGGPQMPNTALPLLEQATFVEAIRHLRRSYLEQPDYQGATINRLDRNAYFDKWERVLADEEATLKQQVDVFKISLMRLGRPSVLVSGGIFGRFYPVNFPGMAAQPRFWYSMW